MFNRFSVAQADFLSAARAQFGDTVDRPSLVAWCQNTNRDYPHWLTNNPAMRPSRGVYLLPDPTSTAPVPVVNSPIPTPIPENQTISTPSHVINSPEIPAGAFAFMGSESVIPVVNPLHVQRGNFEDIRSAVRSGHFYPIFLTGLSGIGKTTDVEQVCALLRRELFRVNITCETDEDDLLGGFRLVSGNMEFQYGPVIQAMMRGAVLLLDEIDLASNKIMCLQPVLEGKGVFLKKISKFIEPKPGFTIIATANTKGQGSETGKFIGTNVLNEAFLDRFSATIEQEYPDERVEVNILTRLASSLNCDGEGTKEFVKYLVKWAGAIRVNYTEGRSEDVISTRRLIQIITAYSIFNDRMKAISMGTKRFVAETQKTFVDFYKKIDPTIDAVAGPSTLPVEDVVVEVDDKECPF